MTVKSSTKEMKEVEILEFKPVGKYRTRLKRNPQKPDDLILDIREFVGDSGTFVGYTRRGIRLDYDQAMAMLEVLHEVKERWPK